MHRAWIVGTAAAAVLVIPAPAGADPNDVFCRGEKVTISWRDPGVGERIVGTSGPDVILGGPKREIILGGGGDDFICGGGGEDEIDGGIGRDELAGGDQPDLIFAKPPGNLAEDIVDGGRGPWTDSADYSHSPVGIRVNLVTGSVQAEGSATGGGITGIESVVATDEDDELIGDPGKNVLDGLAGNDGMDGRGGHDHLDGGPDTDTLSFEKARAGIVVNAHPGNFVIRSGNDEDRGRILGFDIYLGSRFDDTLVGSKNSERLVGGAGEDTLKGLGEGDALEGEEGDDTIFPGPGDDLVDGGPNDPVKSKVAHGDLVSYQGDTAAKEPGSASSFDFEAYLTPQPITGPPAAFGVGTDPLIGIESIRAPKSAMSYLEGDDGPNVLIGGSKIDLIKGLGGNDLLFGLGANDSLAGDDGDDYLDGGEPSGETQTDTVGGGEGDDTCLGARPDYYQDCEMIG